MNIKQYQPMNQSRAATTSDLRNNSSIRSRAEMGAVDASNATPIRSNANQNPQIDKDRAILERILGKAIADQITTRECLTRDENLVWVVLHGLSHKGLAGVGGQFVPLPLPFSVDTSSNRFLQYAYKS